MQWHPKINQIAFCGSNGTVPMLYDPEKSRNVHGPL